MIGAPNTRGQKYWVGIVQWAPATSVSEEIADIFRNYDINMYILFKFKLKKILSFILYAWIKIGVGYKKICLKISSANIGHFVWAHCDELVRLQ